LNVNVCGLIFVVLCSGFGSRCHLFRSEDRKRTFKPQPFGQQSCRTSWYLIWKEIFQRLWWCFASWGLILVSMIFYSLWLSIC
jgi:hypothetical protein